MQSNGNSLYRHSVSVLKRDLEIVARIEASKPRLGERGAKMVSDAFKAKNMAMFDALNIGDSLQQFGICAIVAKKNAKSVITTSGTKYTLLELGVA